jgi:sulfate transport system permease protein
MATLLDRLPLRPKPSVLPGYGLAMGFTLSYLSLLVLIPLAGVFALSASLGTPWSICPSPCRRRSRASR